MRAARRAVAVRASSGGANSSGPSAVKVAFKVPYRTHFGQCLGVVGTGDALGHWDGTKAVKMTWSPGDYWVAEIEINSGPGTSLEYKYVVLNNNGQVCTWKPGKNYRLEVKASRRMLVCETWDDNGPRTIEAEVPSGNADQASAAQPQPVSRRDAPGTTSSAPAPQQPGPEQPIPGMANGNGRGRPVQQPGVHAGVLAIKQEARSAMQDLADALDRQLEALERNADPAALEIILGDRLLAAANTKAVALNRAVRASEMLPSLPPNKAGAPGGGGSTH